MSSLKLFLVLPLRGIRTPPSTPAVPGFTIFLIEDAVHLCLIVFSCILSSPVLNEKETEVSEWQDASNYSLELWQPFHAS